MRRGYILYLLYYIIINSQPIRVLPIFTTTRTNRFQQIMYSPTWRYYIHTYGYKNTLRDVLSNNLLWRFKRKNKNTLLSRESMRV